MIGVLKSLGADNRTIRHLFLWFSVFLIGKGMLWGNAIGLAFYFVQRFFGLFKLDPTTYYMDTVPVSFNLWIFLAGRSILSHYAYPPSRLHALRMMDTFSFLFPQELPLVAEEAVEFPAQ